jgi:AcrR family transcriptional regulator
VFVPAEFSFTEVSRMSDITKRALEASLKNLLLKKPVNKITINDIVEDCGVNRATFYYHFQDIYALIEWSCEEDSKKALARHTTYDTWQQGFLDIFRAVEENKPFIVNVYRHVSQEQILEESKVQAKIVKNAARYLTGEAQEGEIAFGSTDNRKTYNNTSSVNLTGNNFYVRANKISAPWLSRLLP